jgi:di/tricarboxylate transporter
MTPEILTTFAILIVAMILFVTEFFQVDVVALLVLVALTLTGLITSDEALSGFSNPAVVTVWAVLILGGALSRTGIASLIGNRILKFGGQGEKRLLGVIMGTAGLLSGFMNSIGVASLFLPVVIDVTRRTKQPRSKFLMPLAYAALLGGLLTLIGTPSNILISQALTDAGFKPFQMFDFTPIGLAVMLSGILFIMLVGQKLLPSRDISQEFSVPTNSDSHGLFELHDRMFMVTIANGSPLIGKTLVESRLGAALDLNVVAIWRDDEHLLSPTPDTILHAQDRILVEGKTNRLEAILGRHNFILEDQNLGIEKLISPEIKLVQIEILPGSPLDGSTLRKMDFRRQYKTIVLAIRHGETIHRTNLENLELSVGDCLLVQGSEAQISFLISADLKLAQHPPTPSDIYNLGTRLMLVRLDPDSSLVGNTLVQSHLGEAFGLGVMGIFRQGVLQLMPDPDQVLIAGDHLLIKGKREDLATVEGLQALRVDKQSLPDIEKLESERIGLVEAMLSPYTRLAGKTLNELHFRLKYGLNVLAIWRGGRPYRSNLRDMALQFGDALLLYGPREKSRVLGSDPDFLVLATEDQEPPLFKKAPLALAIMIGVLASVILGWLNIAIATIVGVVLMVTTRCLSMEEAYRAIQWKAIFLIAGMLPLGIAMQKSGAAIFLANKMIDLVGHLGAFAVLVGLFLLAALASQVMPNPAVVVLLSPIAIHAAATMGTSPYPLMMTVAIAASASFLSPVGHAANVLVMGPGGYRFIDYLKLGFPLTLVIMAVVLLLMPVLWPF